MQRPCVVLSEKWVVFPSRPYSGFTAEAPGEMQFQGAPWCAQDSLPASKHTSLPRPDSLLRDTASAGAVPQFSSNSGCHHPNSSPGAVFAPQPASVPILSSSPLFSLALTPTSPFPPEHVAHHPAPALPVACTVCGFIHSLRSWVPLSTLQPVLPQQHLLCLRTLTFCIWITTATHSHLLRRWAG